MSRNEGPIAGGKPVAVGAAVRHLSTALVFFFSSTLLAQTAEWGARGIPHRLLSSGHFILAADGRGVTTYDVANPSAIARVAITATARESTDAALLDPSEVAVLTSSDVQVFAVQSDGRLLPTAGTPLSGTFTRLASSGSTLAVADANGVSLWSADANGALQAISRIPVSGTIDDIAFHRGNLLIAVDGQGIYDYTTAGQLVSVAAERALGLAVNGDMLYVAAGPDGLTQIDLTNDAAPIVKSRVGQGNVNVNSVAAAGHFVYTTEGSNTVHVFDTSGATPQLTNTFQDWAQVLLATPDFLALSGSIIDGNGLKNGTAVPVRLYTVSSSGVAAVEGEFDGPSGAISGAATDGSIAYVVDPPYFRDVDVSDPANPHEIGNVRVDGLQDRVKIQGRQAIVYGRGDVDLIDISDPYNPRFVGVFHSHGNPPSNAAFAGEGGTIVEGNPFSGFHVIDFNAAGPGNPGQIAGIKGHYKEVIGSPTYAYLFDNVSDLYVADLRTRGTTHIINGMLGTTTQAEYVPGNDQHPALLLSSASDGFRTYSLDDPQNPRLLNFIPMTGAPFFGSSGNTTYIATPDDLTLLDVPSQTVSPTGIQLRAPMQVSAAGSRAVVADTYSLRIIGPKTAPPSMPVVKKPGRRRSGGH